MTFRILAPLILCLLVTGPRASGRIIPANPDNYRQLVTKLRAGDTLALAPGKYLRGLPLRNLQGTPGIPIVIRGAGEKTILLGRPGANTMDISDCSYLEVRNLTFDGRNVHNVDAIKAGGGSGGVHHVTIANNLIRGHGGNQQTCGISTKVTAWDWVIRDNVVIGAGTGLYLGNSNGEQPFIRGLVEGNLVKNPKGYCMQIKRQNRRPLDVTGIPKEDARTIIRNNVFIKDDRVGESGLRPNLLVGAFPPKGLGARDVYEIYGNVLWHNHRESLFQGTGRISLHDNLFVDTRQNAIRIMSHHGRPPELVRIYHNTFVGVNRAINATGMKNASILVHFGNLHADAKGKGTLRNPTVAFGKLDPRPVRAIRENISSAFLRAVRQDSAHASDFFGNPKPTSLSYQGACSPGGAKGHPIQERR
jgi:hypothetical protein